MRLAGLLLLALAAGLGLRLGWGEPLGAALFRLDPGLLNMAQAGIQRRLAPWLWDDVLLPVLEQPSWLVPAVLGALLLLAAALRRRRA
ncbi:hypothetical protein [Crenalkalicoccus roseus]|uniref:hypothetical protein n=1 Tax=Crenalkalicoccus roseus TaxID=1485588 RepID=UPI00107FE88E|nr:hypothetical protein [Crenalkalicoccus roseus]